MRGLVPDSVLDRREKIGFAVPLRDWLLGSRYASRMAAAAATLPCVNTRRVAPWLADLAAGRAPGPARTFLLWRLIGLAQWTECYDVAIA
jgi:asparagine synthase (glutamine-hydrolysing)